MNNFKHLSTLELIDLFSEHVDQYYELRANAASPADLKVSKDFMKELIEEINYRNSTISFSSGNYSDNSKEESSQVA